ncbi:MAG: hypothetical protein KAS12_00840 [Candidatus Aenigmarchaeota archaeon]|nr:hypothetical protein [Candidatus Aenigmarchaeota archaeon]
MNLTKSIFIPLTFFDLFNYPLTLLELWRYLYQPEKNISLSGLEKFLEESDYLHGKINKYNGYYCLSGREKILAIRQQRYSLDQLKIKRAKLISKLFIYLIPSIKMIAVVNDLAYSNAPQSSDIDLLIVTRNKQLFFTRFCCIIILKLLGLRPTKRNKQNKICLSFFLNERTMNLQSITLPVKGKTNFSIGDNEELSDIYLIYWLAQVLPIYGKKTYTSFWQSNQWIKQYLPNCLPTESLLLKKIPGGNNLFSWIGYLFEPFCRWIELVILPTQLKKLAKQKIGVIINRRMIKLHSDDRRDYFRQQIIDRLNW